MMFRSTYRSAIGSIAWAALVLAVSGCMRATSDPPITATAATPSVVRVIVGKPQRKTLVAKTTQPARIEALETTPIFSKLAGYVERVHVDIGQIVKKGEILVTLREPELADDVVQKNALVVESEAKLKQAEANVVAFAAAVETANARIVETRAATIRTGGEYERAKSEHERLKQLASSGSVTDKVRDEALSQLHAAEAARDAASAAVKSAEAATKEAEANAAKAQADRSAAAAHVEVAKAELAHAGTMLEYAKIRAPFDGVITKRLIDTGHFVQPAASSVAPLLTVARADQVRVYVEVPEMEAANVKVGEPVVIHTQAMPSKDITAKVTATSWSLDPMNRSLRAIVDIANDGARLRPGMYAMATIELVRRENALTVPETAILRDGGKSYCNCVQNGKIKRQTVQLGKRGGPDVEILSGLSEDDEVVVTRTDTLSENQAVATDGTHN